MMKTNILKILIILFSLYLRNCYSYIADIRSNVKSTIGGIWPKPNFERRCIDKFMDPNNFEFVVVGESCDILEKALIRYTRIIKESIKSPIYDTQEVIMDSPLVSKIVVNLTTVCERFPYLGMDESYKIFGAEYLTANSIWGLLRALESYSQAIIPTFNGMLKVPHIRVFDSPRFRHRGLMLDTARHYIKIDMILKILDGMSYNKLNVFHWHIVDDQSFPYQSVNFPELSKQGAYMPLMIYTQKNISNIIEYARMRGIRVVPEFDVPAHTRSWGNSHPEILTACEWWYDGKLGPIDPIRNISYYFLKNFFNEIIEVFPDKCIHIGGNEINFDCWRSNEAILNYITVNKLSLEYLYNYFMNTVALLITKKSISPILWQEAILDSYQYPSETIIQVQLKDWENTFNNLTKLGYRVILSECWNLNKLQTNWKNDYNCDPHNFNGNDKQKKLVIGGEGFIWTNFVGNHNILQKIFPRICAISERLWSKEIVKNITEASQRLEEHICRMKLRGIPVDSPSGLGPCRLHNNII